MARTITLAAFCLALPVATARGSEDPAGIPSSVYPVHWSEGTLSPGVCAGKARWFLSVVPRSVEMDGSVAPRILAGEEEFAAAILHFDPLHRLCLLESSGRIPASTPVAIANSYHLKPGASLLSLASGEVCRTTVAGKDRSYLGQILHQPLLRVRIEDSGRSCCPGTPLINPEGELEGVLTERKLHAEGEAHAIPSSQLRKLISDFKDHRRSGLVWIGLVFHGLSSTPEVIEVRPDSPAMVAGLRKGDIVVELAGIEIDHIDALTETVYGLPAGRETNVTVLRRLDTVELSLVPEFATQAVAEP